MSYERNDLFMSTIGAEFELGDFAEKKRDGKAVKNWYYKGDGGNIDASVKIFSGYLYIASVDKRLYKIDPHNGKKIWEFHAGGIFATGAPAFSNSRIFIGNCDHNFYCLDEETGKEIWRFRTGDVLYASPLVVDEMVVFTSKDFFVYSLDTKTGKMLWSFRTGGWAGFTPVTDGESIFVGSSDGYFYCLDFSGKEKWRFRTNGNIFTKDEVPIVGGVIYFGSDDGNVYGVDVKTGSEKWRFKTGGVINRPPVVSEGMLYILSHDGYFYCIDIGACREVWRFKTSIDEGGTKAVVLDDRVLFASADYNLYCLDKKGKMLWKFRTGGHIWSTPAFYKGRVYLGSYDCRLYCLDMDGKVLWRFETSNLNQALCIIEYETAMEFKPPVVEETREETSGRYAVKSETTISSEYTFKSEYSFKSEYQSKSEYR
jgi:outer membrane protein assembly factor BamB